LIDEESEQAAQGRIGSISVADISNVIVKLVRIDANTVSIVANPQRAGSIASLQSGQIL
jgi:hypothetical protein